MEINKIYEGDALSVLKTMPDNYISSVVTDPPYGISFMNKKWDYDVPPTEIWFEILRVLKPGGHLLCACGTRTQHRMVVNIENAGFEIRDVISWIYGQGFPKSLNVGDGLGTALKPAQELWTLARKPLSEKNITENIARWSTGAINIDLCRIPFVDNSDLKSATFGRATDILGGNYVGATHGNGKTNIEANPAGRFPANVILSEETAEELDKQAPKTGALAPVKSGHCGKSKGIYGNYAQKGDDGKTFYGSQLSGASRFFYCAKASKSERDAGLDNFSQERNSDRSKKDGPGGGKSEKPDEYP